MVVFLDFKTTGKFSYARTKSTALNTIKQIVRHQ